MAKPNEEYILAYSVYHDSLFSLQNGPKSKCVVTQTIIKDYTEVEIEILLLKWDKKKKCCISEEEPIEIGKLSGIMFEPFDNDYNDRDKIDSEDEDICELYNIISDGYEGMPIFHIMDFEINEEWRGNGYAKYTISHIGNILSNALRSLPVCTTFLDYNNTKTDSLDEMRQTKRMRNLFTKNGFNFEKQKGILRLTYIDDEIF